MILNAREHAALEYAAARAGVPADGFLVESVARAYIDSHPPKIEIVEPETPDPPQEPVTKHGDVWILGEHRLMCGDSADADDVAILMNGRTGSTLMATDPPYGVDFAGAKYNPRAKDWEGIDGDLRQGQHLTEWLRGVIGVWSTYTADDAAFYFWVAPKEEGAAAAVAIKESGLHIQSQIIWVKNCLVLGQADYQWKHECCWYAFRKGKKHRWFGGRDKTTTWEVKRLANGSYVHPMQKPIELYSTPIEHHTRPGELIVEPFSGSGTMLCAAEQTGRVCYAMEISAVFVDVGIARWEKMTGKKAERAPVSLP